MNPDQPAVLMSPVVAQEVANTVMGGSATPEEVAVVVESAGDSFENHVMEGKTHEEAAKLVDEEMQRLMLEAFTPEEIKALEEKARAAAASKVVSRMEQDRAMYDAIMRTQLAGGPEVNSHGRTVTNPERFTDVEQPRMAA
ncbi:hypothetical protein BH11PAT4_BH11PAT4_4810 [soil metagenome]